MSVGLHPIIETLPRSGAVGSSTIILETNLTGARGVTFNGVAAAFTVDSASEITATMPAGAASGVVKITTPARALSSGYRFIVLP